MFAEQTLAPATKLIAPIKILDSFKRNQLLFDSNKILRIRRIVRFKFVQLYFKTFRWLCLQFQLQLMLHEMNAFLSKKKRIK